MDGDGAETKPAGCVVFVNGLPLVVVELKSSVREGDRIFGRQTAYKTTSTNPVALHTTPFASTATCFILMSAHHARD
jgi:type I site-specific restriction-modification system R (restriction) subunit